MDALSDLVLAPAAPGDPQVAALLDIHHRASRARYAAEDCHALAPEAAGALALHGAWRGDRLLAIGGLLDLGGGAVELKSMHTAAAARGQGVAARLLAHLVAVARAGGWREMLLEAGRDDAYAAPARALYARAGFVECPPFGGYVARPASLFLRRDLLSSPAR